MLHRVALVRSDVSEEPSASIIRVTRIGELGTILTVTSNRRILLRNTTANVVPSSPIFVILMMEVLGSSETRSLQEPHGVTSQKTPFLMMMMMMMMVVNDNCGPIAGILGRINWNTWRNLSQCHKSYKTWPGIEHRPSLQKTGATARFRRKSQLKALQLWLM
jgi:hypothetical protein